MRSIYGLDDIKRNDDRILLDVVAFPPNPATAGFQAARPRYADFLASCREIRANVITEDVVVPWANSIREPGGRTHRDAGRPNGTQVTELHP